MKLKLLKQTILMSALVACGVPTPDKQTKRYPITNASLESQGKSLSFTNQVNVVANGTFDSKTGWRLEKYGGSASFNITTDKKALINISNGTSNAYGIILARDVALENGTRYQLKFDAKAAGNRSIFMVLQKKTSPHTVYYSQKFNLTNTMQGFTGNIFTSDVSDGTTKLSIMVGGSAKNVTLDNVRLFKETGEPTPEPTPSDDLNVQIMKDSNFRGGVLGAMTSGNSQYEVQRNGNNTKGFLINRIKNPNNANDRMALMSLPLSARPENFDSVTLGQRHALKAGKVYELSLRVKWQNPNNGSKTAIISFWANFTNSHTFAGRDEFLTNGNWKTMKIRFLAIETAPILAYVSLLPNQIPVKTDILVDDFSLKAVENVASGSETRTGNIVKDPGFSNQTVGTVPSGAWKTFRPNTSLKAVTRVEGSNKFVRLSIPANTDNFSAVQLLQTVNLKKGQLYNGNMRIRWDNFGGTGDTGLLNYTVYHAPSNTWYGYVDYVLNKGGWHQAPFVMGAPYSGDYQYYVQMFGWGNFGDPMTVSVDNFVLKKK